MKRATVGLFWILSIFALDVDAQQTVHNAERKFSLTIPMGFQSTECQPPNLYAFMCNRDELLDAAVVVTDLKQRIIPGRITKKDLLEMVSPDDSFEEFDVEYWKAYWGEINVVHLRRRYDDVYDDKYIIDLPCATGGIRIAFSGFDPKRSEVYRQQLRGIVDSIDGEFLVKVGNTLAVSKKLPWHQRIMYFTGGLLSVVGYAAIIGYLLFRICLIKRAHRFVALRRRWLAVGGISLFLGCVIRGMTVYLYSQYSEISAAFLGGMLALLVLNAQSRLAKSQVAIEEPAPDEA